MSKYTCFDVSVKDHVAHVVMNRPDEFNSMTRLFWKELPEIVKEFLFTLSQIKSFYKICVASIKGSSY